MAVIEKSGLMKYKDEAGNVYLLYPITTMDNVDGMEELLFGVPATSTDGVTYAATIPGVTELKAGIKFTIIPNMDSTAESIELNVNGLGALPLKARRLMNSSSSISGMSADWLRGDYPITVMYNGNWWVTTDFGYAHSSYLYGTVPVRSGGTGQVDLTAGSYLVGNGTGNVQLKTPAEVRTDIGATLFNTGVTTQGDGAAYTATIDGITELTAGLSFIMIPHTASTSQTATLDLNGLGAKMLRRPLSSNNATTVDNSVTNWLYADKPVRVMYNGTHWIVMDMPRPHATDLYGTVAIANGGTGATTAEAALANLGAAPAIQYGTTDVTAGAASSYPEGTLYVVVE